MIWTLMFWLILSHIALEKKCLFALSVLGSYIGAPQTTRAVWCVRYAASHIWPTVHVEITTAGFQRENEIIKMKYSVFKVNYFEINPLLTTPFSF